MPVGLLGDGVRHLLLQAAAALAGLDDAVVELVQPLDEAAGAQLHLGIEPFHALAFEPAQHRPQPPQVTVQAHAGPPHAGQVLAREADRPAGELVLDLVELVGQVVVDLVDAVGQVLDDQLEQGGAVRQAGAAGLEGGAGRLDRGQRMAPAGQHQPVGHGEMQVGQLVADAVHVAHQVGHDAVDDAAGGMDLLMLVARQHRGHRRQVGRRQPARGPRDGEVARASRGGCARPAGRPAGRRKCRRRECDRPRSGRG